MPHGGPFARDAESWDWWSQYLAELGLCRDPAQLSRVLGLWHRLRQEGQGEWGLKMQDDLDDAVAWWPRKASPIPSALHGRGLLWRLCRDARGPAQQRALSLRGSYAGGPIFRP